MKRKSILLAACMLLLFCACQGKTEGQEGFISSDAAVESPDAANVGKNEEPTPPVTAEPVPTPSEELPPEPDSEESPTPVPSESAGAVVTAEQLEAYFEDAVFIGDSIMEGVRQYVAKNRSKETTLGNAQFLTSTLGVSVAELLEGEKEGPFYRYNGKNQPLLQILPQMNCRRIFLQLGLNDMAAANPAVEKSVEQYSQLVDLLQSTVPDAEIIIITNPPKVASTWLPSYTPNRSFGNKLIAEYVNALVEMCEDRGIPYVDAYAALLDGNGALPDDYCRDGFVHLNDAGSEVVVEELYRFAAERIG